MKTTTVEITTNLEHVSLKNITLSETNKMFRDENEISEPGLKELVNSVQEKGVIQPVLLRPNPSSRDNYILVCGERRYRASVIVSKTNPERNTIPAYIRTMTDEEAFELQITENLQRKDVHPIKEAKAYKYMIDNVPNTTSYELSLRFGKSESYILQRLKLNDLIPEAKKDFIANKMSLGHALLLARLTKENQHETIEENSNSRDGYGTLTDFQHYIERNIICNLEQAPFNTEDTTLVPKAGACSLCPKRTGCSPMLFSEIKQKNLCVDRNCYNAKWMSHLTTALQQVIETEPEIYLIRTYNEPSEQVQQILDQHKVKALKEHDGFNTWDKKGPKVKAFWISGKDAGTYTTIHLPAKNNIDTDSPAAPQLAISRLKERLKRSIELDQEKIHMRIVESIHKHQTQQKDCNKKMTSEEEALLWFLVYDNLGYSDSNDLRKVLKLKENDHEHNADVFQKLNEQQKTLLLRKAMANKYLGKYPQSTYGKLVHRIAQSYKDIPVSEFIAEQTEMRERREERAQQKLKALSTELKSEKKKTKK